MLGLILTTIGVWGVVAGHNETSVAYPMTLVVGSMILARLPAIAIHEIGHALAAWALGRRVYDISIGKGPPALEFWVGVTRVSVGVWALGGQVVGFPAGANRRWSQSLFLLAGGVVNFTLAGALIALIGAFGGNATGVRATLLLATATGVALANIFMGVGAFAVHRRGALKNDGWRVLELWRNPKDRSGDVNALLHDLYRGALLEQAKRWQDAYDHYRAVVRRRPDRLDLVSRALHVAGRASPPAAVVAVYFEFVGLVDRACETGDEAMKSTLANIWGNAAWQALRDSSADRLALANNLSARALDADPTSWPLQATRGAVLVALGDREPGRKMIEAALREDGDGIDKAEFIAFLAADAKAHGDPALGQTLDELESWLLRKG